MCTLWQRDVLTKISIMWIVALTMWEEDRWAPAKRRLTPPNAGRDSVQPLERG